MGNSQGAHKFLAAEPNWDQYVGSDWRSDEARELDKLGGLNRPAVCMADTMAAKLGFLENRLRNQGDDIVRALDKQQQQQQPPQAPQEGNGRGRGSSNAGGPPQLHTEMRAHEHTGPHVAPVELKGSNGSLLWVDAGQDPVQRGRSLMARQRMIEYAKLINATNKQVMPVAPPAPWKGNARTRRSSNLSTVSSAPTDAGGGGGVGDDLMGPLGAVLEAGKVAGPATQSLMISQLAASMQPLAENGAANWRVKIHNARRRATIVIRAVIRLKRGMNHPRRMQRIDSFSFYIPQLLGDNVSRFSDEQSLYFQIQEDVANCKASISDILEARFPAKDRLSKGGGGEPASSSSSFSTHAGGEAGSSGAPPAGESVGKGVQKRQTSTGSLNLPLNDLAQSPRPSTPSRLRNAGLPENGAITVPSPPSQPPPQHPSPPSQPPPPQPSPTAQPSPPPQQQQQQQQPSPPPQHPQQHQQDGKSGKVDGTGGDTGGDDGHLLPLVASSWRRQDSAGHRSGRTLSSSHVHLPGIVNNGRRLTVSGEDSSDSTASTSQASTTDSLRDRNTTVVRMMNGRLVRAVRQSSDGAGAVQPASGSSDGSSQQFLSIIRSRNQQAANTAATAGASRDSSSTSSSGVAALHLPGIRSPGREKAAAPMRRAGRYSETGTSYVKPSPIRSHLSVPAPEPQFNKMSARISETGLSRSVDSMHGGRGAAGGPDSPGRRKPELAILTQGFDKIELSSSAPASPVYSPSTQGGGGGGGSKSRRGSALWSMDESKIQELARITSRTGTQTQDNGSDRAGGGGAAPSSRYGPSLLHRFRNAGRTIILVARINRMNHKLNQGDLHDRERLTILCWQLGFELSLLKRSGMMLGMFANRGNASWAERQTWGPAAVWTVAEQDGQLGGGTFKQQMDLAMILKRGQLAVQIFAGEDYITLSNGLSRDLWTSDPWALVAACRPGAMPLTDRIQGLPLGTRILMQLALAVEALAGQEAVSKVFVVLHINDGQQYEALADLADHQHFGFKQERVLITLQNRRPGYRYDAGQRGFLADNMGSRESIGTGYALAQMSWVGEAFYVTEAAEPVHLSNTLLEHLSANGVEWMTSHRVRDLSLLSRDGVLDVQSLSFALLMQAKHDATMTLQVTLTDSPVLSRQHDSVVLAHYGAPEAVDPTQARQAPCVDLRCSELCSPTMVDIISDVSTCSNNERLLVVGLHRYAFHVPALRQHLTEVSVFRPKLARYGASDLVHVTLELSDLTAAPGALCLAVQSRQPADMLFSAKDIDALVPLVLSQDNDPGFRSLIARTHPALGHNPGGAGGGGEVLVASSASIIKGVGNKPGQRIVVFVSASEVTHTAVSLVLQMARAGRDVIHLVTVVPASLQEPTGQALIKPYFQQLARNLVQVKMDVVVKGAMGLLECLERYVISSDANLVVMGSRCLTSGALNSVFNMGSLTLSCLKRLQVPMMLVTANSHNVMASAANKTEFRALGVVDVHARPMINYLCNMCMDTRRGDRLMLAHVHPTQSITTNQITTRRRLMDTFTDIAKSHNLAPSPKAELCGPPWEKPLLTFVQEHGVHVLGVQVPAGNRSIPGQVLQLIRSCRGAVLLYRDMI